MNLKKLREPVGAFQRILRFKRMYWLLALFGLFALPVRPDLAHHELRQRYAPEPSRFMEVSGMQVHYRDQGQGMPVVLLHGMASSLHTWEAWADTLQQQYRIISVDLPGWGLTGPDPQKRYTLDAQVAFLAAFLDSLGIEKCVIGGNSMGGWFSWNFAIAHPERVLGLILVDAAGVPASPQQGQQGKRPSYFKLTEQKWLQAYVRVATPRVIYRKMLEQVYVNDSLVTTALVNRYYYLMRHEGNRQAFLDRAEQRSAGSSRFDELTALKAPVLVLWGEKDPWIPAGHALRFQEQMPQATVVYFPELGHVPMEEAPMQTVAPLWLFLAGLQP
jgi:pimeloyl-ACP methyl ester carboxylesterase